MKGLNPNMDQGIDITLLPDSCPMDEPDFRPRRKKMFSGIETVTVIKKDFEYDDIRDECHYSLRSITYPVWRTREDELIPIKDMETSHIKNCIHMIHRKNGTWRHQYLRYFENELRRRKHEKEIQSL